VESDFSCFFELMNSAKDFICGFVAAASFPPPFNNTPVVSEDLDVLLMWLAYKVTKCSDEEFKADCFGQPISRPSLFQPGRSRHALHLWPMMMPILMPELASE